MSTHVHTVLIVEDYDDMREGLALVIQTTGLDVISVRSGREALDRLEAGLRPCIVLLDLVMPEMDGFAFRQAQLADPELASIPVAAISGGGQQIEEQVRRLGITHFLQKPFEEEELLDVIGKHCLPN